MVSNQPAIASEPAECALDHPPFWKWVEACLVFFRLHDRKKPMKAPPDESAWKAFIPTVGKNHLQSGHFP